MDTSTVEASKHTLTRGGKRLRPIEEKRRIVEEALRGEESVAVIARRHAVNANLVFSWKRLYQKGLLEPNGSALLPAKIDSKSPVAKHARAEVGGDATTDCVEIEFADGRCVRVRGKLAVAMLDRLVMQLCSQ